MLPYEKQLDLKRGTVVEAYKNYSSQSTSHPTASLADGRPRHPPGFGTYNTAHHRLTAAVQLPHKTHPSLPTPTVFLPEGAETG